MVYKVEIVKKDNINEIRYIGNGIKADMKKLIELDEFRDVANTIMHNNPKISYDKAFSMAKDLKSKANNQTTNEQTVNNNFEKAKVKVLTLDKNAS